MNNLHLQKFQFFRFTEESPNNDIYGFDVWDKDKIFLTLISGEIYCQYLDLGLDMFEEIKTFDVVGINGNVLTDNNEYFSTIRNSDKYNVIIFGFKEIINNQNCNTYYLRLTTSSGRIIFSNYFNIFPYSDSKNKTSLVTYRHPEKFYNADYTLFDFIPQQMRLPVIFSHHYNEADAESYQNTYELENKYRSGRVKRLFMESWKVTMNDSNYIALCTALDSDEVYFNNYYFSIKPFVPERDKDENGFTTSTIECQRDPTRIFDQGIWGEYLDIYADDITYNFDYDHTPVNTADAGQWFLVNRLYNNYVNDFGITYNCQLKFKLESVPVKGFLANNISGKIYNAGDVESYCEKDNLSYYPNGFDNNLGIMGDYTEQFTYRIIDQYGNKGRIITHTINMTDTNHPEVVLSANITWYDNSTSPKTGKDESILAIHTSNTEDPYDPIVSKEWQHEWEINGIPATEIIPYTSSNVTMNTAIGSNSLRLKLTTQNNVSFWSNTLYYTRKNSNVIIYNEEKYIYRDSAGGYNNNPQKHWTFPMPNFFVIPEDGEYKFEFIIKKTVNAQTSPNLTVKIGRNRNGASMDTFTDFVQATDPLVGLNDVKTSTYTKYYSTGDVLDVYYEYYMGGYLRLGLSIAIKITKI